MRYGLAVILYLLAAADHNVKDQRQRLLVARGVAMSIQTQQSKLGRRSAGLAVLLLNIPGACRRGWLTTALAQLLRRRVAGTVQRLCELQISQECAADTVPSCDHSVSADRMMP